MLSNGSAFQPTSSPSRDYGKSAWRVLAVYLRHKAVLHHRILFTIGFCIQLVIFVKLTILLLMGGFTDNNSAIVNDSDAVTPGQYWREVVAVKPPARDVRDMNIIWEYPGGSCTGFGVEATNFVLGLDPQFKNLRLFGDERTCPGMEDAARYEKLVKKDTSSWKFVDFYIVHTPPTQYPSFPYDSHGIRVLRSPRYIIGRSMAEVLNISAEWVQKLNEWVDEVWVPSKLCKETFIQNGVSPERVHVILEPIRCESFTVEREPLPLDGKKGFNFLSIFKWEPRKGYDILLKAYFMEFSSKEDVSLHVKTYLMNDQPFNQQSLMQEILTVLKNANIPHENLPTLHILTGELSNEDILRVYKSVDAYVQPARGEGWGLPIAEAMASGLPTIATSWGGQNEYMNAENSYQIAIDGFSNAHGPCCFESWQMWSEPSLAETRRLMRYVFEHREEAKLVGERARADMLSNYCKEHLAQDVHNRLQEIANGMAQNEKPRWQSIAGS